MSAERKTTYLITGANRGLGRGYVETYLARPNNVVLAAVRDPAHPTAKSLADLPVGPGSQLHVIKLDCSVPGDSASAIALITSQLNITSLDVVIGNAAIVGSRVRIADVTREECLELWQVNAWSLVELFQAAFKGKLLHPGAKFVITGTNMANLSTAGTSAGPFHDASYSFSKVVLHYAAAKLGSEHPELVIFLLDPGDAATDMGVAGIKAHLGLDTIFQTVEETVAGCVDKIDKATRDNYGGGKYIVWDGTSKPW